MTKREFLEAYALARATTVSAEYPPSVIIEEAIGAWDAIEAASPPPVLTRLPGGTVRRDYPEPEPGPADPLGAGLAGELAAAVALLPRPWTLGLLLRHGAAVPGAEGWWDVVLRVLPRGRSGHYKHSQSGSGKTVKAAIEQALQRVETRIRKVKP